ncbi:BamA/TamA family outer membrane protein [Bradyrhizobium sp. CER78]|uniref:BamA/TamA family outer membrane protein n=1 Tax=Bradyrhizobium sp. CER78 TaxID=3039162 RepID=UPI002449EE69|nr:BamA/TamA family outer membrane protein [Bradyrhizobium sp. CER78]MDH2384703.1 BamA/TamA family outer membrane protein [Bradyrhizobium sp. CER78]
MCRTLLPICGMIATISHAAIFGVGLIWASPFGPLRFDYAVPITKGKYDIVQEFRFGGGTSF